jgi:hypothetical protein
MSAETYSTACLAASSYWRGVIARNQPHDRMTATRQVSNLPYSGEPAREFSRSAQKIATLRSRAVSLALVGMKRILKRGWRFSQRFTVGLVRAVVVHHRV